jgi:hypothetical protein
MHTEEYNTAKPQTYISKYDIGKRGKNHHQNEIMNE